MGGMKEREAKACDMAAILLESACGAGCDEATVAQHGSRENPSIGQVTVSGLEIVATELLGLVGLRSVVTVDA